MHLKTGFHDHALALQISPFCFVADTTRQNQREDEGAAGAHPYCQQASMLDEAIDYMKSLQLQIQMMWMGRGMAPMMLPAMQHYMSRGGMGIGPPMLPAIQNLMRLSRMPPVDQPMNPSQAPKEAQVGHNPTLNPINYQNSSFQEQYDNFLNFHSMQNASPQAASMFNFGFHSGQPNLSYGNRSAG